MKNVVYNIVMLFDIGHILYIVVSTFIIVKLLIFFKRSIKEERKDWILKYIAVVTVVLHFSSLYVDFFSNGSAEIGSTMLLPIYPCNVIMWMLLIVAFYKNKDSKTYKILAEATFYMGIVGGVVGIAFNEVYSNTPTLLDWDVLKGLLSHSTMLLGCLYLLVGDYIKIRVDNVKSIAIGLLTLLADGVVIISLFAIFGLEPPNSMFLLGVPYDWAPKWLNIYTIFILSMVLGFAITAIYEEVSLEKEDRWYNRIKISNKEKIDANNIFRR